MSLGVILASLGGVLVLSSLSHAMWITEAPLYAWLFVYGMIAVILGVLTWDWD